MKSVIRNKREKDTGERSTHLLGIIRKMLTNIYAEGPLFLSLQTWKHLFNESLSINLSSKTAAPSGPLFRERS